jgi:hypothetical protein
MPFIPLPNAAGRHMRDDPTTPIVLAVGSPLFMTV